MWTVDAKFNLVKFGGARQLSQNFWGCPDTHVTHCCCAYASHCYSNSNVHSHTRLFEEIMRFALKEFINKYMIMARQLFTQNKSRPPTVLTYEFIAENRAYRLL
jgi:hypothetical protein